MAELINCQEHPLNVFIINDILQKSITETNSLQNLPELRDSRNSSAHSLSVFRQSMSTQKISHLQVQSKIRHFFVMIFNYSSGADLWGRSQREE